MTSAIANLSNSQLLLRASYFASELAFETFKNNNQNFPLVICAIALRHGLQKRKGSEMPYIVHPIGVANILANEANVDDIVVLQVGRNARTTITRSN